TTLLAAEVFFVAYLLAGQDHFPGGLGLLRFMAYGCLAWAIMLLAAVLARVARRIASTEGDTGGLTPGIRSLRAGLPGPMRAAQPPVWPFLVGAAVGVLVADALTWLGAWLATDARPVAVAFFPWRLGPTQDPSMHLFAAIIFLAVLG